MDVGSNSVLLLVSELSSGAWHPIVEFSQVTALGEGTSVSRLLGQAGIDRTLDALLRAFDLARQHGAEQIVARATMAARIASNAQEFMSQASAQGTPVQLLSGEEEADLGMQAVLSDPFFSGKQRVTVVDVGGHSTELATARRCETGKTEIVLRKSYPIGTLNLRGSLLTDETPNTGCILEAVRRIDDQIGISYLPGESGTVVALGATGTNLVSIRDRLSVWIGEKIHGQYLDYEEISKAVGWMSGLTDAERACIDGLEAGRERTIHIGALILERFLFAVKADGCYVSVRGWRHALLERCS